MPDYTKAIGAYPDSFMMIRDTGLKVEFWLKANSIATWQQNLPYGWTVNGVTGSGTHNYNYPWPGGAYPTPGPLELLRSFDVAYSQSVTFRLGKTATAAFQGPHTFTVSIQRATVRVNVSGVWKLGIPYVHHGGKWKVGQVWVKDGPWKRGG